MGRSTAAISFAALVFGFSVTSCAPAGGPRAEAWRRYVEAESAYEDCRTPAHRAPPPCETEKAAYKAAREHYRIETGDAPPGH
jgi:hypothetical protein